MTDPKRVIPRTHLAYARLLRGDLFGSFMKTCVVRLDSLWYVFLVISRRIVFFVSLSGH